MIDNQNISSDRYRTTTYSHRQPRIYGQTRVQGQTHIQGQTLIHEQTHFHEHEITKCLHETSIVQPKGSAGAASGGMKAAQVQPQAQKDSFSLRDLFADGLRSLASRVSGFWRRLGEEDGRNMDSAEKISSAEDRKEALAAAEGNKGEISSAVETGGKISTAVLSTAMIKPENKKGESPETSRRRVNQVEGSISGGLEKGQGGIRKFFQKFGETAARAGRFLGRKKREEENLLENNTDLSQGDSSFLLDSYNRMGEYSTLAKDRSLEGKFRVKG